MTAAVHVSSLVVQVRPDRFDAVRQAIESHGGEIPNSDRKGKLVVVIETGSVAEITRFTAAISEMDGVLSANLVYHLIDGEESGGEPRPATAATLQGGTT